MMTEIPAVRGFIRMCTDGWEQGWHERNGGNLTYRMKPEEVEQCRPFFTAPREWNSMGVQADNLKGEYFITTGFAGDTNVVTLLTKDETEELPMLSKDETADRILTKINTLRKG